MGKLQSKSFKELEDNSLTLLELDSVSLELDRTLVELLLDDCEFSSEDEDSDFTELDDSSFFEDEDFAFSLLLDRSSTPSAELRAGSAEDDDRTELLDCCVTLEEDDSTAGSSFDPADADDESSHAAKNATMLNATKIFFIKIFRPRGLIYPVNNITFFTHPVHFM